MLWQWLRLFPTLFPSRTSQCSAPQPGTVYLLRYTPVNCRWAPSSAGWRLSFSSTRWSIVRRRCDWSASSAPYTNIQTQLNSTHLYTEDPVWKVPWAVSCTAGRPSGACSCVLPACAALWSDMRTPSPSTAAAHSTTSSG